MELREGYKKTEIGVVPEDWEVKPIGEITAISVGRDLKEGCFSDYRDDKYKYPVFSNTVVNKGLYGYYNVAEYVGESLTVVGRGVGLGTAFKRTGGYGAIGRLLVLMPKKEVDANFLTEYINHKVTIFSESGGIPQLTGISFAKYHVPLPPLPEQKAIAEVLSDTDNLIQALEKRIAKKRLIKQGAMQKLLTPKEDWEVKKLGEIASNIASGKSNTQSKKGKYPIYGSTGIIGWSNSFDYEGNKILVARVGANAGTVNKVSGKYCISDNTLMISFGSFVDIDFLFFVLINFRLNCLVFGSGQPLITGGQLKTLEVKVPTLAEQTRIAIILSDMDNEIETLEKKLAKYKQIKQGLMQNLLTGKIRLV